MKHLILLFIALDAFSATYATYNKTTIANALGLTSQNYLYLMGLSGTLTGFVFLGSVVYITISWRNK